MSVKVDTSELIKELDRIIETAYDKGRCNQYDVFLQERNKLITDVRIEAIDECISVIDDIYNNDKHCILDECKSSNNCSDCLYLVIGNKLEQLKEQK